MDGERGRTGDQADGRFPFPLWLSATMRSRGLSQAQLARSMGVAETQVSRWRRGLAVPTVYSLQRLAETLDVPRSSLEQLAGYPDAAPGAPPEATPDAEQDAEKRAYQAQLARLLEERVPPALWPAYLAGCAALADALRRSLQTTLQEAEHELRPAREREGDSRRSRGGERLGFRTPSPEGL